VPAAAILAVACGSILAVAAGAGGVAAAATSCQAWVGSSGPRTSNLAAVLTAAKPGDTVNMRGTCTGNFKITVPISLVGTVGAILNGGGTGTALTIDVPSGTVNFDTIEVTGGSAAHGGGIAATGSGLTLNMLYDRVNGNTASVAGAGLYTSTIAALNINKSEFLNDTLVAGTHAGEGAGVASSAPVSMSLSNIIGDKATSSGTIAGGAVYLTGPADLYAIEVEHTTVTAGQVDGAGLAATGAMTLNYSTISDNAATTTGGSIAGVGVDATGPKVLIEQTAVFGNTASTGSGQIHGVGIDLGATTPYTLSQSSVYRNRATSVSGAVTGVGVSGGGSATIANSGILTNQGSSTTGNVDGGGIAVGAALMVSDGLITANQVTSSGGVSDGGGIWMNADVTVNTMTVGLNKAGTAGGGAFVARGALTIEGSRLVGDTAPIGGAIDNVGGTVTATGSLIIGGCVACSQSRSRRSRSKRTL
jgi:hypothetical protein